MTTIAAKKRGLSGLHVLAMVLLFFGSVIAVNTYFVVEALKSFPGEDEAKSYAQGLKFNTTLADRAQQATLGWRAEVWFTPSADGPRLEVHLADRNGAPLNGLSFAGELRRPVDAREDHALTFVAKGQGVYVATVEALEPGQWTLHAQARGPSAHFDIAKRLLWPTPAP